MKHNVDEEQDGRRLDSFFEELGFSSRSQLKNAIDDKAVHLNRQPSRPAAKVQVGDTITFKPLKATSSKLDIPILYEDDNVIVFDKPIDVLTHRRNPNDREPSIESIIAAQTEDDDSERRGIVHRLDRETSGVIITAKNSHGKHQLQKQFADRTVTKVYVAIVEGRVKDDEAIFKWPIERNPNKPYAFRVGPNGKAAQTTMTCLDANEDFSLLQLKPSTGRTHQLRVHLSHYGCPIAGDSLYGTRGQRLYLHAQSLRLTLPSGKDTTFESQPDWQLQDFKLKWTKKRL